jgi:hypothetical protein
MLPKILVFCYELLHGTQDPVFRDQIYEPAGIALLISTVLLVFCYYYGINGLRARFSRTWPHWSGFLILNAIVNVGSILWIASRAEGIKVFGMPTLLLCFINAVYAALGFFIASAVFKWGSPNARRTPF